MTLSPPDASVCQLGPPLKCANTASIVSSQTHGTGLVTLPLMRCLEASPLRVMP